MAGRSKKIRNINSYVNNIDNNNFSGPMKSGTTRFIGTTRNFWHNYETRGNQNPQQVKKSYSNMVFLNINSAITPCSSSFTPSNFVNYTNYQSYNNFV